MTRQARCLPRLPLTVAALALGLAVATRAAGDAVGTAIEVLRRANAPLEQFTLDNGMVCLLKRDTAAPVVSVQVWVGAGSIHEHEYLGCGLSHAIEHMIFNGTATRAPNAITREINDAGGSINAYTTFDRVVFHADLPSRHWRVGFDAIADSVMHAAFPDAEWQQEREVILREFAMGRDDPDRVIDKLLWSTAFAEHPYRHPVIGHEDLFRQVTRDDLAAFFKQHYVPDNMILAIVGDVDTREVRTVVTDTFAGFARRPRPPVPLPREPEQFQPRRERREGDYEVARLVYAFHTVPLHHPDAAALDVLAAIAGDGRSSILVRGLREERRLVHEIDAWSYTPREPGLFGVSATFAPEREAEVCDAVLGELASLAKTRFRDAEIDKAIRRVLAVELGELATMKGQASAYASGLFFAGDPRFGEVYLERLRRVTPDALRGVAARYLTEANRTLVVLAPRVEAAAAVGEGAPASVTARPVRARIENDIPVIVREDRRLPFVDICVALRGGLLAETEDTVGITAVAAELLVRGTADRDARDIALAVERVGGQLSAFSGYNSFGLQARCMSADIDGIMALIAECLAESIFAQEELDKVRELQIAAIRRQREQPMAIAQANLRDLLFPGHPYRWDRLGTEATVGTLDRRRIRDHYRRLFMSGNLVIAVFGDIDADAAAALAAHHFRGVPRGRVTVAEAVAVPQLPRRVAVEEPRAQAIVLAGFPGVTVFDPRADALGILEDALSGLASDLAEAVRGDGALAYYVGAYQQLGLAPGAFVLYAGTRADAVADVETLFAREISRVITDGLREEELARARGRLIAEHDMSLQNNGQTAMTCALDELYGLGYDHAFSLPERLRAVTARQVREAAGGILDTNRMAVSVVTPDAQ